MSYKFARIITNDTDAITVYFDGEQHSATSDHPHFEDIVHAAQEGDPDIIDLFDTGRKISERFEALSRRVSVAGNNLFFDNEPVHGAVAEQVIRFYQDGEDFQPLVNFLEKLAANPQEHSRDQLYNWLDGRHFTIREDGDIIAYKGVRETDGEYFSISTGSAIVNGEKQSGAIPNPLGAVVEMPRSQVEHDPSVGCHTGLHAGTWDYASDFARGAVLKVAIDPADVVSVPTDCGAAKLRTCRYTVLEVIDRPVTRALDWDEVDDIGFDDEDDWDDFEEDDEVHAVGADGVPYYIGDPVRSTMNTAVDYEVTDIDSGGDRVRVKSGNITFSPWYDSNIFELNA